MILPARCAWLALAGVSWILNWHASWWFRAHVIHAVVFGPTATKWFQFLQNHVNLSTPKQTLIARVAADQLVFAPIMIRVLLSSLSLMEGGRPRDKLQHTYWKVLQANWSIWPILQGVNLYFVPLQYQVLTVNLFSIGQFPTHQNFACAC